MPFCREFGKPPMVYHPPHAAEHQKIIMEVLLEMQPTSATSHARIKSAKQKMLVKFMNKALNKSIHSVVVHPGKLEILNVDNTPVLLVMASNEMLEYFGNSVVDN